ncbi:MAG: hypothetical protein CL878_06540 [Dehalococcoidia bacterium]|nr:hypothetical protein [Dehalococcoidia bacterium]
MTLGSGDFTYDFVEDWPQLPAGWSFGETAGVAVDARDRIYVFHRGEHPLLIFERDGSFVTSWGEGVLEDAHGLFVAPDGSVYVADRTPHVVRKFSSDGKLLLTLGTPGQAGEGERPFKRPTDVAVAPSGDIYVSDGYGNRRAHRFAADGTLIRSWGEPGTGPGQFDLPHSIWADEARVYVADRENHRIQLFTLDGDYLDEWTGFRQPTDLYVDAQGIMYIAELQGRVSIVDLEGQVLAHLGGAQSHAPGEFYAPHGVWTDSHGDLYVGEVLEGKRLQKFARRR